MSRTTIAGAATELYDALSTDANGTPEASLASAGVVKIYPKEPGASGVVGPAAVTIQFTGWDPTNWLFAVRYYVSDSDNLVAQNRIIAIVAAADALLRDGVAFGPSQGTVEIIELPSGIVWVANTEVTVGREDGF